MGRLSDARKKAKGGVADKAVPEKKSRKAEVEPPVDAIAPLAEEPAAPVEPAEPISFAAEGRKLVTSPQIEAAQRLADELLAGVPAEEEEDESDVYEPGSSSDSSESLPSSGLAEDLLAEMERRAALKAPASKKTDEFMSAWPTEPGAPKGAMSDDDFFKAHQLGDDVLAMMGNEPPPPKKMRPAGLPSSGLADEVLRDMPAPSAKTPLGVDEVHEFEAFFEEERAAEQLQLVLFQMETELFALEIDRVQEIIRVPAITRVPHSLDAVRGVCNLRGRIVPVLDLRKLMRLVPKTIDRFNRIMVLDVAGKRIGVLIDRVSEVARINVPDVEPPPEELRAVDANLVTAVARLGDRMIFILDVDRVLALK